MNLKPLRASVNVYTRLLLHKFLMSDSLDGEEDQDAKREGYKDRQKNKTIQLIQLFQNLLLQPQLACCNSDDSFGFTSSDCSTTGPAGFSGQEKKKKMDSLTMLAVSFIAYVGSHKYRPTLSRV